jgi:hypothetical protein
VRAVHVVDLSTLGYAAASALSRLVRGGAGRGFGHPVVASSDRFTRSLLSVYGVRVRGWFAPPTAPRRVRALSVRRLVGEVAGGAEGGAGLVQPWGRGAGMALDDGEVWRSWACVSVLEGRSVGSWPVVRPAPAASGRSGRLVVLHVPRCPAPVDASWAAYVSGVPAMAGHRVRAVLPAACVARSARAVGLTRNHAGAWVTVFDDRPLEALIAEADLVVCARPREGDGGGAAPAELASVAAAGVPMVVDRSRFGGEAEASEGVFAATRFVEPTDRMAMPRAIAAVIGELRAREGDDGFERRIERAREAAWSIGDPAAFSAGLVERWRRVLNAGGRRAVSGERPGATQAAVAAAG